MKTVILLTSFVLLSATTSFSQEVTKQKEIGISFSNFDSFGLFYRLGKPSALWRFNSAYGSAYNNESKNDDDFDKTKGFSISISAGREYRKVLIQDLEGRVGFDVSLGYQQFESDRESQSYTYTRKYKTLSPGANAVLGLNYIIKQKMIVGVELTPGFYYTKGEDNSEDANGYTQTYDINNFGLTMSNIARISIAYRF